MTELRYKTPVRDSMGERGKDTPLEAGECTIYGTGIYGEVRGIYLFRFRFLRKTDGKPETRTLPIEPNGPGNGIHKEWGLMRGAGTGRWHVTPSIQCLDRIRDEQGNYHDVETWHETPVLVGVPEEEPWTGSVPTQHEAAHAVVMPPPGAMPPEPPPSEPITKPDRPRRPLAEILESIENWGK